MNAFCKYDPIINFLFFRGCRLLNVFHVSDNTSIEDLYYGNISPHEKYHIRGAHGAVYVCYHY